MTEVSAEGGLVPEDRSAILARIASLLEGPWGAPSGASAHARGLAARHLYAWQRAHNPAYAAMTADHPTPTGPLPATDTELRAELAALPAVPVALFKELDLSSAPVDGPSVTFRTSGTTGQTRGVHRMRDTRLYERSAATHAARMLGPLPPHTVSLCPPGWPGDPHSDSSLGHMVDQFADGRITHCFVDGALDAERAWASLRSGPVFLATTAFSLDALLAHPGAATLGPDSLVMVTGGFKGRRVRLDAEGLYRALAERLGAPRVVGEYGMTELSSQLWTRPVAAGEVPGAFVAPPWLRVFAVDPLSGVPVGAGEGLLRFVDLANVDSVLAIETMDLGVVEPHADGDVVTLRGRLEGAEARGCSLRAEDLLERTRG